MVQSFCRHFSGYKPCGLNDRCDEKCPSLDIPGARVLIIHLEALGAVLRSTSLLAAIKIKYPSCHISWVTRRAAVPLLENNPNIDRIIQADFDGLAQLGALEFDVAFCIDKSLTASGLLRATKTGAVFGFRADPRTGAIRPATPAASELWEIGLDDRRKFFVNQKPETQLSCEALELGYRRDEYDIRLTASEIHCARDLKKQWGPVVIGLNTGCSPVIGAKKLTVEFQRELAQKLRPLGRVVLLGGGPEDARRNREIAAGLDVIETPCEDGLRSGLVAMKACDIVVTGDSLGMHMAIALKKWTVAWFGPTCAHEIDLFGRGEKVLTHAGCAPCWKRSCSKPVMCYDQVSAGDIKAGVEKGLNWLRISSSKPPTLETFSSRSP